MSDGDSTMNAISQGLPSAIARGSAICECIFESTILSECNHHFENDALCFCIILLFYCPLKHVHRLRASSEMLLPSFNLSRTIATNESTFQC